MSGMFRDPDNASPGGPESQDSLENLTARVAEVLEMIRPAIKEDGGDVEFLGVDENGVVSIRFLGACVGCPSSEITLQEGIARNLRDRIPEVTDVRAVA